MPADGVPLEQRLNDGAKFMRVIAERMDRLADEVRDATREARDRSEQAQREQLSAEYERDSALEEARQLADEIEAMRLGLFTPEEVIDRHVRAERSE